MNGNRRNFLKIAGASILGLSTGSITRAIAAIDKNRVAPDARGLIAQRWAMVIDHKKCKNNCTDCITACHTVHNVPKLDNPGHEIKWIWTEEYENAFPGLEETYIEEGFKKKPFLVLCNHCDNPPCVRVCPTQATFKREDGIVMMDYHRCIGCRFCMAACPYGSRSFNYVDPRLARLKDPAFPYNPEFPTRMKGVVEKCNFCYERLAVGMIPACVEACKQKALTFGDVEDKKSPVRLLLNNNYTVRRKTELGTMPQVYYIM